MREEGEKIFPERFKVFGGKDRNRVWGEKLNKE
jgi:hypothetical protein